MLCPAFRTAPLRGGVKNQLSKKECDRILLKYGMESSTLSWKTISALHLIIRMKNDRRFQNPGFFPSTQMEISNCQLFYLIIIITCKWRPWKTSSVKANDRERLTPAVVQEQGNSCDKEVNSEHTHWIKKKVLTTMSLLLFSEAHKANRLNLLQTETDCEKNTD